MNDLVIEYSLTNGSFEQERFDSNTTSIDLSWKGIATIDTSVFSNFQHLLEINLRNNPLKELTTPSNPSPEKMLVG
ncbi:MAG: hypothetical protein ACTSQZ_02815 [Candidatus Thorarchaeota archaeon]